MYYVDPNIANAKRIFPEQNRGGFLRLDMNENPKGLPEEVVERIRQAITPEFLATYPEPDAFKRKYADLLGVSPSQVFLSNGSDNSIRYILQTFARKGAKVLTVSPTFEMYMVNCWLLGLEHVTAPYTDDMHPDVEAMRNAITDDVDIVALVNPNNPLGDVYDEQSVRTIVETAAAHDAIVVIDEAYHYFTPCTFLGLINEYENLIVLRTFSKCLSLAGVRLGAAISSKNIVGYLNNLRVTFEVNTFALKCGEIVLDTPGLIEELAGIQISGRSRVLELLEQAGYEYRPSESNFVSFKPRIPANTLEERLRNRGILVKTFGSGPLAGWIRINTGDVATMERFFDALTEEDR